MTLRTGTEQYMKALEYAHRNIDRGNLAIVIAFLDEAREVYHDLEVEAGIMYEGGE